MPPVTVMVCSAPFGLLMTTSLLGLPLTLVATVDVYGAAPPVVIVMVFNAGTLTTTSEVATPLIVVSRSVYVYAWLPPVTVVV